MTDETTTTIRTGKPFSELYADLVSSAVQRSEPPANSFTVAQFSNDSGIPQNTARRRLAKLELSGVLESGEFMADAHLTRFYWFVEEKK
jgi:Fic family protein